MNDLHLRPCPFCGFKHPRVIVDRHPTYFGQCYWPREEIEIYAWCDTNLRYDMTHGCGARSQGIAASADDVTAEIIDSFKAAAADWWNRRERNGGNEKYTGRFE